MTTQIQAGEKASNLDSIEIKTSVIQPVQRLADLVCNCIEGGGISSWLGRFVLEEGDEVPKGEIWYAYGPIYNPRLKVRVEYDDPDKGDDGDFTASKIVTFEDFRTGLRLFADNHRRHFNDWVEENDDAITADVFMQLVILGEVVYG